MMELRSFLAALEETLAAMTCYAIRLQGMDRRPATRDDLREYASDYYHHVAAFPAYLSALHSRLDDGEQRRACCATCARRRWRASAQRVVARLRCRHGG